MVFKSDDGSDDASISSVAGSTASLDKGDFDLFQLARGRSRGPFMYSDEFLVALEQEGLCLFMSRPNNIRQIYRG